MRLEYQIYGRDRTERKRSEMGNERFKPDGLILLKFPTLVLSKTLPSRQDNSVTGHRQIRPSMLDCSSRALHEYPREVTPLAIEDNEPQDRYHDCGRRTSVV